MSRRADAVGSLRDYESVLRASHRRLAVLLFSAGWCEFCRLIRRHLDEFAERYRDVAFYQVEVGAAEEVARRCRVRCFPTFQFYRDGSRLSQLRGPNRCLLERMIQQLQGGGSRSFPKLGLAGH